MATITAAGIGSGLDINGLLEQIVAAERAPTENRLNVKEANLQAELTAFGTLKGAVSSFQSSLGKLKDPTFFNSNDVSVSNTDVLTASISSVAQEGNYSVEVQTLAQSHALASIAFDSLDDVIGSGTLSFNFGSTDYDPGSSFDAGDDSYNGFVQNPEYSTASIVIDNTNNTVSGLRDAINSAQIGVSASIVDDGNGYRLLLTSTHTGADNSMQISVDEGGAEAGNLDTSGLSVLAFNAGATNAEQTQVAQDARLNINGLTISRDSNTITGAIHGVTLKLLSTDIGQPVQVKVDNTNVSETESNISKFVTAFNELATTLNGLTAYNVETGKGGILTGDATARNILLQIRRELGGVIENGGAFNSLSSIGITTNRDGTLSLDSDRLNAALNDDFDSVAQLFYASGKVTDSNVRYLGAGPLTQVGRYPVYIDQLASHGQVLGEAVSGPLTIDSSNDSFSLVVDGVVSGVINITQGTYNDLNSLAELIQTSINNSSTLQNAGVDVAVEYVDGQFRISSASYGEDSSVVIATPNSTLGLTANATQTPGSDVSGSIGGVAAAGAGQILTGAGAASGLRLEIDGSETANRGAVFYSQGIAGSLDSLLTRFLASDGQLSSKTDSIESRIENISTQRDALTKRIVAIEERYRRQFEAMDVLLGQLQATSDYLQQQLDTIPQISINKK